jgi:hypothetical protein
MYTPSVSSKIFTGTTAILGRYDPCSSFQVQEPRKVAIVLGNLMEKPCPLLVYKFHVSSNEVISESHTISLSWAGLVGVGDGTSVEVGSGTSVEVGSGISVAVGNGIPVAVAATSAIPVAGSRSISSVPQALATNATSINAPITTHLFSLLFTVNPPVVSILRENPRSLTFDQSIHGSCCKAMAGLS